MAGRGGLALLLLLLVAVQWAARAEAKTSNLCSKFPSFCDQSELDDDKKGRSTHQRFAETKWRKPKGETEIRGHLVAKRPLKDTEAVELDDAAALRAATIREAEEKLRQAESGVRDSFDKRRTVEDARRKAHLIKEARRKRRQRLEEAEAEEDDEDEMVVEVEEDEDEEDHDDDDDAVVEDEDSEEDDDEEDISEEESAEAPAEEQEDEEYVEEEEEEEVEKEEEEEEEEEEESDEELDLHDDDPEDDDERRARKKLHESAMRRRKWKEEEARMKRREEERKRAEEEERKKNEDGRKRRIEELRKKKRQEEEARRQKEDEEEQERQAEQQRLEEEERARREAQHRRVREEKEKEEQRRLEEKVREERRRREEQQKEEEQKREEERRRAVERQEKEAEEERERQEAKERDKKLELERERSRQAEEDERKRKEEDERKRKAEDEERERKRKLDEEEKERKRQADEEERKRKLEEQEKEKERKAEEEKERKRKAEQDEKERKRKLEEDEKERKRKAEDEEKARRRKAEEEENKKLRAEEESKKKKLEEESRKKKEVEEKSKATEREEKPKKRSGNDTKGKVAAKEDSHEDAKDRREDDEEDLTSWMSGFPEFFAPTADDDVKNEECRKQSRIFVQHLAKYKMWALNMYDATAKLPSGVLSGNAIQLGDFDECLGVDVRLRQRSAAASGARKGEDDADDADVLARAASWFSDLMRPVLEPVLGAKEDPGLVHIRGQYCLAGVDLELRRGDAALRAALDRSLAHSFLRGSLNDSAHFVPRFRTLGWGVCVPEACAPRDVELALRGAVSRFQRSGAWGAGLVRARVGLPRGACRVAPRLPAMQRLPPSFFLAGGGLAALLLLALVATIKDTGHEPDELGGLSGVVASFSLRRNWSTLTAREDPGADDIRCIHGIRCVCSLLLYAAHKLVPLAALPFSNRRLLTVLAASPASLLLRGSLMYTDTFLMLSGTLAAFHLSKHLSRGGSLDWAGRLATRVTRLTPTLGLVTVAYAYVLEHLGTGPLWGQLVEENGRICREHMWRNLLYVHNLWPFEQMCAPHTHQLALDMQLSLLVPPLVWLLVKSWPLASPVILVLAGGSTWLRQQAALQHNVSLLIYNGAKPADLYRAADMSYTQATHRASAYLAGVVLGYLLHRVPRKLSAPKVVLALGWLASASLGGWAMFSQRHVARFDYRLDVADAARFNALAPLAWAAAMAWLIFACYTGHGGWLDRLLCARPLVLLSRISYAFYLVQFLVFFYNAGSVRSQREFSVTAALDLWELVLVLALATVVTLLVELPMQSVRSALGSSKRRQSLKWDPPSTPITPSPHELPAAYYYNPGTDVYTSHAKEE